MQDELRDEHDSPAILLRVTGADQDPERSSIAQWIVEGGLLFTDGIPAPRRRERVKRSRDIELARADANRLLPGCDELIFSTDPTERAQVTRLVHALWGHNRRAARIFFPEPYFTVGTIAAALNVTGELVKQILEDPVIGYDPKHVVLSPGAKRFGTEPTWPTPERVTHGTAYAYVKLRCRCDECRHWNRERERARRAAARA